jgi:DHA2 family multidrug resistance protein-like MFS transporter
VRTLMDGLPTPRRYFAILSIALGTALSVIDGTIVNVALPNLARDLGVAPSLAVLVVTVYQLTLVTMLLPLSALGQRIGLKRLYQAGQLVFIVASILCFFARSLPFLLVVRVAQGLGAAATLCVSSALIRAIYPDRWLGRGLSISTLVVSTSNVFSPTLGGLIITVATWPWLFAAAVPLGVFSLILGRSALPEVPRIEEPYDVFGAVLCALTFGLLVGGLESLVHGDSPVIAAAIFALGTAIAVVFVRRELVAELPILPVDLLGQRLIALSVVGAGLAFIGSMVLTLSLPFRLQEVYGFQPSQVGAMIMPWPAAMMIVSPISALMSDRFPAGILGAIGMSIAIAGFVLMATLPPHPTQLDITWRMAVCGVGYGMYLSPNSRLIVSSAPVERAASAGGLISTNRLLGQTLGATLLAALLDFGHGADNVPAIVAAVLAACACVCSMARIRHQGR